MDKANRYGIRAAQLPIGRYLQNLPTRKVLTVNQVFEILVKWVETRDWEEALYSVIPKRKFQPGKGSKKSVDGEGSDAEGDDDYTKYWLFVLKTMRWSTVRRRHQVVLLSDTHDRSTHGSFRSWRPGIRVFGTYEQSVTCVGLSNTTVFGTFYA